VCTQRSWKRPYGVGLLVAGFDKAGAKLFYCCPSGAYFDYKAMAIGARSQARCQRSLPARPARPPCAMRRGAAQRGGPAAGGRESGARAQAAKTYLERKFEEFEGADLDALIRHGLQARARQAPSRPAPDSPGLAWCPQLARVPARIAHLARTYVCVGDRVANRLLRAPCRAQGVQVGLTQARRTWRRRQAAGDDSCRRAAPRVSLDLWRLGGCTCSPRHMCIACERPGHRRSRSAPRRTPPRPRRAGRLRGGRRAGAERQRD